MAKKTDENLRYLYTELEQKNHKLRNLALTDSLTGLFNYHYLKNQAEVEFERSMRGESPLSAFMIDI
ncbi:MAG: GGDEF domain-containing protein, partial [Elusimicrobia bacterium]|nr:GGDEF domain-containing protein [Elusimicrobiota bacterium]